MTVAGTATINSDLAAANINVSSGGTYSLSGGTTSVSSTISIDGSATIASTLTALNLSINSGGSYTLNSGTTTISSASVIAGALTTNSAMSSPNLTINSGGLVTANSAITVSTNFTMNGTGKYIHNNTTSAATTIFSGTENFAPGSTIEIRKWWDSTKPLAQYVSGNFGNVIFNSTNGSWDQKGQFAPNKIKGTLTVSKNQITLDGGSGNTTVLTLQDVVVNNSGNLLINSGPDRNLTLVTNNFIDTSNSIYVTAVLIYSYGTLTWTVHGSITITHDFSAIQGTGTNNANDIVQIDNDLNIGGGLFDFNYLINGSLVLNVDGNTNIYVSAGDWSHLIFSQTQFLQYTTNNITVTGNCTNNYLQGSTSFSIIHVKKNFTMNNAAGYFYFVKDTANTSNLILTIDSNFVVQSGNAVVADSKGNSTVYIGKDFNNNSATANFTGQYRNTSATTMSITINHDLNMLGGQFVHSYGKGDITFAVNNTMNMDAGSFFGISSTAVGNFGKAAFNINYLDYDGGALVFRSAYLNDSRTTDINITGNCDINFTAPTDYVIFENISNASNNAKVNFDVGGNFTVSGNTSAYLLSSGNTGNETVDITGNMNISGGNVYFAGDESGTMNGHNIKTNIGGNVTISGGNIRFACEAGTDTINIVNNLNISGGTATVKWNTGTSLLTVGSSFAQTGGTLNLHNRNLLTTNPVSMVVNGNFSHTGGTLNFDSYSGGSSSLATHTLKINGANYTVGGTGIITHINAGTANTVFGEIYFARNGTTVYNRSSATHDLQQVKMYINSGTTVDASSTANSLQITSHQSSTPSVKNALTVNGTLTMGVNIIQGRAVSNYNSQVTVGAGGRLRTQNSAGLYSGNATASCIFPMISGNNTMDYFLDPASTVEYYGTSTQKISGIPTGIATGTQHKYGNLDINSRARQIPPGFTRF